MLGLATVLYWARKTGLSSRVIVLFSSLRSASHQRICIDRWLRLILGASIHYKYTFRFGQRFVEGWLIMKIFPSLSILSLWLHWKWGAKLITLSTAGFFFCCFCFVCVCFFPNFFCIFRRELQDWAVIPRPCISLGLHIYTRVFGINLTLTFCILSEARSQCPREKLCLLNESICSYVSFSRAEML